LDIHQAKMSAPLTPLDRFNVATRTITLGSVFRDVVDLMRFVRVIRTRDLDLLVLETELHLANQQFLKWGKQLRHDPQFQQDVREHPAGPAIVTLCTLFREAQELGQRSASTPAIEPAQPPEAQLLAAPDDADTIQQRLVDRFAAGWDAMRGWAADGSQGIMWAITDRDQLRGLVNAIKRVLEQLERTYPNTNRTASLQADAAEILNPAGLTNPQQALRLLAQAAQEVYPQLGAVAQQRAEANSNVNVTLGKFTVAKGARSQVGEQYDSVTDIPKGQRNINITTNDDVVIYGDSQMGTYVGAAGYGAARSGTSGSGSLAKHRSRKRRVL
jgi:hypothetical protein